MQPIFDLKRFTFTLRHLFVLVTVAAVVSAGIFYFLSFREESLRRERNQRCNTQLTSIGLALQSYESVHGCYPPLYVADAQDKPLYSWRVLILPWMDETRLYEQWRRNEPWDSPHNRSLPVPWAYSCPAAERNGQSGTSPYTDYLAVVGPGMAWEEGKRLMWPDFVDEMNNTIMVVEVRGSQIHWAEPVDFDGTGSLTMNSPQGLSIGSDHERGANVLFQDASVRHLPDTTSEDEIKALLTRAGGENEAWREEGLISDYYWFGDLRWSVKSWRGNCVCVEKALPFSIDIDVVNPTDEQKALALVAARKVRCDSSDQRLFLDASWDERARLDAAKEIIKATQTDDGVQLLAGGMTLESWGITYSVRDAAVFPYFIYASPQCLPNERIRVQFSTRPAVYKRGGEVTLIGAIDEVTVIRK